MPCEISALRRRRATPAPPRPSRPVPGAGRESPAATRAAASTRTSTPLSSTNEPTQRILPGTRPPGGSGGEALVDVGCIGDDVDHDLRVDGVHARRRTTPQRTITATDGCEAAARDSTDDPRALRAGRRSSSDGREGARERPRRARERRSVALRNVEAPDAMMDVRERRPPKRAQQRKARPATQPTPELRGGAPAAEARHEHQARPVCGQLDLRDLRDHRAIPPWLSGDGPMTAIHAGLGFIGAAPPPPDLCGGRVRDLGLVEVKWMAGGCPRAIVGTQRNRP